MKRVLVYGMTNIKGGIESYVMNIFRHMDRSQIMFDFVTDFSSMAYADEVTVAGAKIYYIPAKGKHPVRQLTEFSRLLKAHPEYDTVYFNILSAGSFYNMIPAIWLKRRTIVHSHNNSCDKLIMHKFFRPLLLKYADLKMACSQAAAQFMFGDRALEHGDVKIIKNAIDTSAFRYNELIRSRKRAELHLGDRFIVGHVGRMDKQKNPLFLIDIFEAIKKQENNASLLYIGIGPMENEVKKYASSKGLDDAIMFLGMRNDVNELLQAMDVFLLPSLYEGLGIVLIEAQASGLPCITTDGKVPVEANICGLVNYLSLDKPAIYWADQLMALRDYERQDRFESIKIAGYDIKTEVEKIEKLIF